MQITSLAEKAMLVKLTMRRANLTKRDQMAEAVIQAQLDDTSLIVNSKLFRDKNNPVNKIMTAASEVYTYHKLNTLPWAHKGPRVLPNAQYMDYTREMRGRINHVDAMIQNHLPNYDKYVQLDIAYRSKSPTARAKVEDYPTAEQFEAKMGFDLRFMPMPDQRHFLFDLSLNNLLFTIKLVSSNCCWITASATWSRLVKFALRIVNLTSIAFSDNDVMCIMLSM